MMILLLYVVVVVFSQDSSYIENNCPSYYTKTVTVLNNQSSSIPFDSYDFQIVLNTKQMIDSGTLASDCSNIRFNIDTTDWLSYYLESPCYSVETIIFVRISRSFAGHQERSITIYYGCDLISDITDTQLTWDGGYFAVMSTEDCPSGRELSQYDGKFVKSTAVFEETTSTSHSHSGHEIPVAMSSIAMSGDIGTDGFGIGNFGYHRHYFSYLTEDSPTCLPLYKTIRLCEFNTTAKLYVENVVLSDSELPGSHFLAMDSDFSSEFFLRVGNDFGTEGGDPDNCNHTHVFPDIQITSKYEPPVSPYQRNTLSSGGSIFAPNDKHNHTFHGTLSFSTIDYPRYYLTFSKVTSNEVFVDVNLGEKIFFYANSAPPLGYETVHPNSQNRYIVHSSQSGKIGTPGGDPHTHSLVGYADTNTPNYLDGVGGMFPERIILDHTHYSSSFLSHMFDLPITESVDIEHVGFVLVKMKNDLAVSLDPNEMHHSQEDTTEFVRDTTDDTQGSVADDTESPGGETESPGGETESPGGDTENPGGDTTASDEDSILSDETNGPGGDDPPTLIIFISAGGAAVVLIFLICVILSLLFFCVCCYLIKKRGKFADVEKQFKESSILNDELELGETNSYDHIKVNKRFFKINVDDLEIQETIQVGHISTTYRGVWKKRQNVAIKMFKISNQLGITEDSFTNIEKELMFVTSLRNPNIITFYGCGIDLPRVCIVLEYADHGNLKEYILKNLGKIKINEKIRMLSQIANGTLFLHSKNIIYRDLKPPNCLVDKKKEIKLTDFGVSTLDNDKTKTKRVGTGYYIAPEVYSGNYGVQVDVFSLAMVIFEVLEENFKAYGDQEGIEFKVMANDDFRPKMKNESKYPDWLLQIMKRGWNSNPTTRGTMKEISEEFSKHMN